MYTYKYTYTMTESLKIETIFFLILLAIIIYSVAKSVNNNDNEPYSQGALQQLMAKGAQDEYLTGDTRKYWDYDPEYYCPFGDKLGWYRNIPIVVDYPITS